MITSELYKKVLMEPLERGVDTLDVLVGYASPAMAFHHLQDAKEIAKSLRINILVGMVSQGGLTESIHKGFVDLCEGHGDLVSCRYAIKPPAIHSKVYVWSKGKEPLEAYLGSANYTQRGFGEHQKEAMLGCDADDAYRYVLTVRNESAQYSEVDADQFISRPQRVLTKPLLPAERREIDQFQELVFGLDKTEVSLLDRDGELPTRSGLNWGKRPEERREPNQAYIRLPSVVYRSDFFPERGSHFTVVTDDGFVMICTRAQDNGKAIHTPHNNSIIGEYFRSRIGVDLGDLVTKNHLNDYGRSTVTFYKEDNENFYMDFSLVNTETP